MSLDDASPRSAAPSPPAPAAGSRAGRVALAVVVGAGLLVLAALMLAGWLLRTESGARALLGRVPMLQVSEPSGPLWGDFRAARVRIALPGGDGSGELVIEELAWSAPRLRWPVDGPALAGLSLERVSARRVHLATAPDPSPAPPSPPASLRLPLMFEVGSLDVDEVGGPALGATPLRSLHARLQAGNAAGAAHRLDDLRAAWDRWRVAGHAAIGADAPFDVEAVLTLTVAAEDAPASDPASTATFDRLAAYRGELTLHGPLAALQADARVRPGSATADAPPVLAAQAGLQPFAAWPLAALDLQAEGLDLAQWLPSAPRTALQGQAHVETRGRDQPLAATIDLRNGAAGRWDQGALPLTVARLELRAQPDRPAAIELPTLDLQFGDGTLAAGRVQGRANWDGDRATLEVRLDGLAPARLDARAPDLSAGGTLKLQLDGLQAAGLAPAPPGAAAPSPTPSGGTPAPDPLRATLDTALDGQLRWRGGTQALTLRATGRGASAAVEQLDATLRTGPTSVTLKGSGQRVGAQGWQLDADATVQALDPSAWWTPAGGWGPGPQRLNGNAKLALQGPLQAPTTQGLDALEALRRQLGVLRGTAALDWRDSQLAGLPIDGQATLQAAPSGTRLQAETRVAGSRATVDVQLDTRPRGDADRWRLSLADLDAARLAPLLRLAGLDARTLAGQLDGNVLAEGRWPALRSSGQLQARGLRRDALSLDSGRLRWQFDLAQPQAPLVLDGELRTLASGAYRLDRLQLALLGSLADHRLHAEAESPLQPPSWVESLAANPAQRSVPATTGLLETAGPGTPGTPAASVGTRAMLDAAGQLALDSTRGRPLRWQGRLERAEAQTRSSPHAWARLEATPLAVQFGPDGRPSSADAAPGRLWTPIGSLAWQTLHWAADSAAQLAVDAIVEPIAVAPLLAQLQPSYGWSGDLQVGGHVRLRQAAGGWDASVEIARRSGDLAVSADTGPLPLGFTDLRLGVEGQNGVWHLTQAFAGKTLGAMASAVTARTGAAAALPDADTPIEGVLELHVDNLMTWGAWVPAGWRLGGSMQASASIGGRLGAPTVTGKLSGRDIALRNLLEGVDLREGSLAVALDGDRARIEQFSVRAGDGHLTIEGDADLGATPELRIALTAERMQVLGRVDRRIVVSGRSDAVLNARRVQLQGRYAVDEGLIDFSRGNAPTLSEDVRVVGRLEADDDEAPRRQLPTADVVLDLKIGLGGKLRLRGRGIDTGLRGELQLTSPQSRLAVNGTVRTADGRYAAYGQSLTIERGVVVFSGPVDDPRLDILAIRPNLDVKVGVSVTGTAQTPRVRLYADDDLSDTEKLSWLVLGRGADDLGSNDTAILQQAALALLAGENSGGGLTDDLTKRLGIDTLSLRQDETSTTKDTVVSLGKQLSRRWYLGYERGLNATAGTWQLIYRIAQRFTLRAQSGLDNSVDLIWTWRWQ